MLVLFVAQTNIIFEPYDFGIANVGSVEKGDEEEQRENGKDAGNQRLAWKGCSRFESSGHKLTEDLS